MGKQREREKKKPHNRISKDCGIIIKGVKVIHNCHLDCKRKYCQSVKSAIIIKH